MEIDILTPELICSLARSVLSSKEMILQLFFLIASTFAMPFDCEYPVFAFKGICALVEQDLTLNEYRQEELSE
jgi:hypothetical protein